MRKELVISAIPQETRVAVLENDELVEFLIERHRTQNIAGNIYKGRVTKVLPGMQSAFVNIGLERDAFLYVSDFFEDTDEYEKVVASAEDEALAENEKPRSALKDTGDRKESTLEKDTSEQESSSSSKSPGGRSSRRLGARSKRKPRIPSFESPEGKSDSNELPIRESKKSRDRNSRREGIQLLPGESLAKYSDEETSSDLDQVSKDKGEHDTLESFLDEMPVPVKGQEEDLERSKQDSTVDGDTSFREDDLPVLPDLLEIQPNVKSEVIINEPSRGLPKPEVTDESEKEEKVASSEESDSIAEQDNSADLEKPRRARITGRRDDRKLTRRPPRRTKRRSSAKSDSDLSTDRPVSKGPMISELLREGQEILVQVSKESLGKKGARITSHIALPGRYIVYMPTVDHIGVSRKIDSEEERSRLRRTIENNKKNLSGGFIVRTAGQGRDEKELIQDIKFLGSLWAEIRSLSEKTSAPKLIHSDLNLVQRVLRDQLSEDFKAIRLDNETEYEKVLEFVNRFQPSLVNRVRLHLKDSSIFEEYGLQQEIDKAMRSKVWLRSGGYIVVNQTEALVAIDVNTGKFVGKSNRLEDTIVRTNMDAVHEIVRQVRLRNLGGIIIVDFIDMDEKKNRQRVMVALEDELRKDRSPSKILQFNDFGLVAITRKRTQPSLERILGSPCPRCVGSGFVKAIETVCYEIFQEVKKMVSELDGHELTVRVSSDVAKALKSGDYIDLTEVEDETKIDIRIQSDPLLHAEHFDIF